MMMIMMMGLDCRRLETVLVIDCSCIWLMIMFGILFPFELSQVEFVHVSNRTMIPMLLLLHHH